MKGLFELLNGMQGEMGRLAAERAAGALIAGLWESTLLVAGVALLLKVVPRTTATARFAVWSAVFCVSAAMPFAWAVVGPRNEALAGTEAGQLRVDPRCSYPDCGCLGVGGCSAFAPARSRGIKVTDAMEASGARCG